MPVFGRVHYKLVSFVNLNKFSFESELFNKCSAFGPHFYERENKSQNDKNLIVKSFNPQSVYLESFIACIRKDPRTHD